MPLIGDQTERIWKAVLDCFNSDELRMLTAMKLFVDFDKIVSPKAYDVQVFELVQWSARQDRVDELVGWAHRERPRNQELAILYSELKLSKANSPCAQTDPGRVDPIQGAHNAAVSAESPHAGRDLSGPIALRAKLGIEMVDIPQGVFLMGSDKLNDPAALPEEMPQHWVHLPTFQISKYPVTNLQYKEFLKDRPDYDVPKHWMNGAIPEGQQNHPVVNVSWYEAREFCFWIGGRLPTEAEWEKAARGTDGRIWPWGGDSPTPDKCNFRGKDKIEDNGDTEDSENSEQQTSEGESEQEGNPRPAVVFSATDESGRPKTTAVTEFPLGASPYEVMDMAGNVWEWTVSYGAPYPYDSAHDKNPYGYNVRITRGGSYLNPEGAARCASRYEKPKGDFDINVGFRVVVQPQM